MQSSTLSRKNKIELIHLLEEKERRNKERLVHAVYESMYGWQRGVVEATKDHHEVCLIAANQIGKTYTGTNIDAYHLLGDYPDDWEGHKFDFAPLCWGLGYSMEKTRDLLQTALFGEYDKSNGFAGGLIPKSRIISWESATGTPNAMRTVRVKHKYGTSQIQFWSYSQGQHAIMGDVVDWFHVDEEPKDSKIRPQLLTRTINGDKGKGGRGIYTFTPENGRTDLVIMFMDNPSSSQFCINKGWNDAPHMTEEKRERLLSQYPLHQRDMRSKGVPMLGHGRIYDLSDDFISCDYFDIPDHWFAIGGMDFGWDHPHAFIKLVEDRDNQMFYVTHAFKQSKQSANEAWGSTNSWAKGLPISWPHDGLQHEKGRDGGLQQMQHYKNAGFNMLSANATWPTGGNSVETGLFQINDLMSKGKLKIFKGLKDVYAEIGMYHRKENGQINKANDDLLDAIRYAFMMRRKAKRNGDIGKNKKKKKLNYPKMSIA